MKRAFSLVEIVVVLLIIGIICAILIKGKETMDAAHIRMEVNKIEKLRNAVASIMSYTNGYSNSLEKDNDTLRLQPFYDLDLLTEDDLDVYANPYRWQLRLCSISIDSSSGTDVVIHDYDTAYKSICAVHEHYYLNLTCSAEFVLDDQSTNNGFGLSFTMSGGGSGANTPDSRFGVKGAYNCDNVSSFSGADGFNTANAAGLPAYSFQEYK